MKAFEQKRRHAGQGGFTLIELLVVIAILGVLAGVVVFAVGGITDNSDESACNIEARTVKTAIQAFKADTTEYPAAATSTTENGEPFVGGLLDEAPELVTITYVDAQTEPTLAWSGTPDCATLTGNATP